MLVGRRRKATKTDYQGKETIRLYMGQFGSHSEDIVQEEQGRYHLQRVGIGCAVIGEGEIGHATGYAHSGCVGDGAGCRGANSSFRFVSDLTTGWHRHRIINIAAATGRES